MTGSRSYLDTALASLEVFSNDGRLDETELDRLLELALRDREVDVDERAVLANVFRRAERSVLSPAVVSRIAEARARHGIA